MKKWFVIAAAAGMALALGGCSGDAEDRSAYREQGIAYLEEGEYEAAKEQFEQAVEDSDGLFAKVTAFLGSLINKDEQDGTDFYRDCYYYLALAQYKNEDYSDAMSTYDLLIKEDKKDWQAYFLRGCVYLQQEFSESAIQDFEQAVSLNEDDVELYIGIYNNLKAADMGDEAEAYLDKAVEIGGDNAVSLNLLGCAAMENEDYEQALSYFESAMDIDDGSLEQSLCRNLIAVYEYMGDFQMAYDQMEVYVSEHPEDEDAARDLEFLKTRVDVTYTDSEEIQGNIETE